MLTLGIETSGWEGSIALLRDGKLVHMIERRDIEMNTAEGIVARIRTAIAEHTAAAGNQEPGLRK